MCHKNARNPIEGTDSEIGNYKMKKYDLLLFLLGLLIFGSSSCGNKEVNSRKPIPGLKKNFEWDFSRPRKFVYSFSQIVASESTFGDEQKKVQNSFIMVAKLNVDVQKDELANLSLSDSKISPINLDSEFDANAKQQILPTMFTKGMDSKGHFKNPQNNLLYLLIFPIPDRTLKKGESVLMPISMPANLFGSSWETKGNNKLSYKGIESFEGRNCARFQGEIDFSEMDIPVEYQGKVEFYSRGKANYYFDLENGYYYGLDFQLSQKLYFEIVGIDLNEMPAYMDIKSENTYKIRFEKIVEMPN